jgi:hypothetical protein
MACYRPSIPRVDSLKIGVVPYGKGYPPFSDKGDSGAGVFDCDSCVLGNINGGGASTDETGVTSISSRPSGASWVEHIVISPLGLAFKVYIFYAVMSVNRHKIK